MSKNKKNTNTFYTDPFSPHTPKKTNSHHALQKIFFLQVDTASTAEDIAAEGPVGTTVAATAAKLAKKRNASRFFTHSELLSTAAVRGPQATPKPRTTTTASTAEDMAAEDPAATTTKSAASICQV